MTNNKKKLNLGKIVEIIWLDPSSKPGVPIKEILESEDLREFLGIRRTPCRLLRSKGGITIVERERALFGEDEPDIDIETIYNVLINEIHTYTRDRKKQYNAVPKELRKYLK